MIKAAILGYGTVGSGVYEIIRKNAQSIRRKVGQEIDIKYILDIRDFDDHAEKHLFTKNFDDILNDDEVKIVVEVMGGLHPAYDFSKAALLAGKNVITSNKELVAKHGPELLKLAAANKCNYLFEASVGGGIPIIRPLNYSLTAEKIEGITGILNGTTNYILSKMEREGANFDDVLKQAQDNGYAERNPEADVEGHDACRKIAILSSLMMGKNVDSEKVFTEGITKITADDFCYAKAAGKTIKLLGMSRAIDENTALTMVAPFMLDKEHPLAMVNDVFNAVFVTGNMLGDSMYYGRGAGKLPTASAVVSDVVDCARHQGKTVMCFWSEEEVTLADVSTISRKFFVRAKKEAKDALVQAFPGGEVITVDGRDDFGYITCELTEKEFAAKYEALGDGVLGRIRVL